MSIVSEAAQILWAKELGIGTGAPLRRLEPHVQEQVRSALPSVFVPPRSSQATTAKASQPAKSRDPLGLAVDYLLADEELRSRCKDLLRKRRHLDRVFREATTVLENRIKRLAGIPGKMNPEPLVNTVLNPDPTKAILVVSNEPSEQAGIRSLCRGIVLTFRHKAHHELDDKATRENALKLCSFVDVLLSILGTAKKQTGA